MSSTHTDGSLADIRKRKKKWLEENFQESAGKDPLLTPADVTTNYLEDLGFAGEYPFTRGIYPSMYSENRLWSMRQVSGYGTPEETRQRLQFLVSRGETQLSVVSDIPTREGLDSDHPMAEGEVGKLGVPIDSINDVAKTFAGLPLEEIRPALIQSDTGSLPFLAMYFAVAQNRGIALEKLAGTIQNDPLTNFFCSELRLFPPVHSMRVVSDIFEFCAKHVPNWTTVNVGGRTMRELGITAGQELGISMIFGIAYIEAALRKGLEIDQFAPVIAHYYATHNNLFEEAAKLRAARRLWARLLKERFGAKSKKSMMCKFHVKTTSVMLTHQQPLNNIIRGTIQGLAAVLGGTQSLDICSYDEALALPTEHSVMMSLRTQQIIAHESGVADHIDPLAGSYLVEHLTDKLEEEAREMIVEMEQLGNGSILDGLISAIESGDLSKQFTKAYLEVQRQVYSGKKVVVGVNQYVEEEESGPEVFKLDPELEKQQIESVKAVKRTRDNAKTKNSLDKLQQAAQGDANLVPPAIEAVKNFATLGEVVETLAGVFGIFERPLYY